MMSRRAGRIRLIAVGMALCGVTFATTQCSELFTPPADDSCPSTCTSSAMIQGCDGRVVIPASLNSTEEEPWSYIGRFHGGSTCSGTLIGDRFVLTAAHCMAGQGSATLGFALAQTFVAPSGRPFGTHGVRRVLVPAAYQGPPVESDRVYDYALAELWEPIDGAIPAPWGHVDWDILRTRPAFTAGYPATQPDGGILGRPWMSEGRYHASQPFGWVDDGDSGLLYTDLDGSGGQSGSAVYSFLTASQHPGEGIVRQVIGVLIGSPVEACMVGQMWVTRLTPGTVGHIEAAMETSTPGPWWTVIDLPDSPTVGPGEPWP